MTTDLLPVGHVTSNPDLYARHWDAFAFRVKQFTCSLSREQRATVGRRPRFHSMPFLRRADEPDLGGHDPMTAAAKQKLADEITISTQLIASSFREAAARFDVQPDHGKAEQLGHAAWSLCETLREVLLRATPADEWTPFLAAIEQLKDTAREWIDFAREQQAEGCSQP